MRLVIVSDTHMNQPEIPEGDFFIHCGDWSKIGRAEETEAFLEWLRILPHPHKVVVPGNHERCLMGNKNDLHRALAEASTFLIGRGETVAGLKIWGSPMTCPFGHGWAFNMEGSRQRQHWRAIPPDLDLLVTHGPPYGRLDQTFWGKRAGSPQLLERITKPGWNPPKIHAFGHIHEMGGSFQLEEEGTLSINAALVDLGHHLVHQPFVIDLEEGAWTIIQGGGVPVPSSPPH